MSAAQLPPLLPGAATDALEPEPEPEGAGGMSLLPASALPEPGGSFSMRRIRSDVLARGGANAALINAWQEVDTDGDDFLTYSVFAVRP